MELGIYAEIANMQSGFGVRFELRLADSSRNVLEPDYKTRGSLNNSSGYSPKWITMKSIYEDLPTGNYKMAIYGQAPNSGALAFGIEFDHGGWGARIILTEL